MHKIRFSIFAFKSQQTCRRPWLVQGAFDSALVIHSRTIFWYNERTLATQAGSLTKVEGKPLWTEKRSESKQVDFHRTCGLVHFAFNQYSAIITYSKDYIFELIDIGRYLWKLIFKLS